MQFSELRHLKRFREIAGVLIKYGFDEIAQRLDLPGMDIIRKISPIEEVLELKERICRALEELGPTFVKIGQIMSLRPDLDVVQEIGDYVSRLAMQRYSPDVMWRNIRNSLSSIWASQREIP
jgi:predicted unusual protein kinase regulating ubiquinone biosynthesis (AarF/ABC1/UbiB family)